MLEHRSYQRVGVPELRVAAGESATIVGAAAVFRSYSQNLGGFVEQIEGRAFDDVLDDDVVALVNHDPNLLLARSGAGSLRLTTDDDALRYEIDLDLSDPDGVSAAAKVRSGAMPGSSFSFVVADDGDSWSLTEQGFPLRTISRIGRLYDVGPVTRPAYKGTEGSGAATAMRSLSVFTGAPIAELVAAAGRNELRSFLPVANEQPSTSHVDSNAYRARQLSLVAKR